MEGSTLLYGRGYCNLSMGIEELRLKIGKIIYAGIFLEEDEREKAKSLMCKGTLDGTPLQDVALLEDLKCDHLTLAFKPTAAQVADLPIGEMVTIRVRGRAHDAEIQALFCAVSLPCKNEYPHITIACAAGINAVQSNVLLKHGHEPLVETLLTGRVGVYAKGRRLFAIPGGPEVKET
jgi:hypothetical protein